MAHFQAGMKGSRGPATRLGSAKSGIYAFARGWQGGARIDMWEGQDGEDRVTISVGPHGNVGQTVIATGPVKDIICRAKNRAPLSPEPVTEDPPTPGVPGIQRSTKTMTLLLAPPEPGTQKRRRIVIISDGDAREDPAVYDRVREAAAALKCDPLCSQELVHFVEQV